MCCDTFHILIAEAILMLTGKFIILCRDSEEKLAELTAEKRNELQKQENARCVAKAC